MHFEMKSVEMWSEPRKRQNFGENFMRTGWQMTESLIFSLNSDWILGVRGLNQDWYIWRLSIQTQIRDSGMKNSGLGGCRLMNLITTNSCDENHQWNIPGILIPSHSHNSCTDSVGFFIILNSACTATPTPLSIFHNKGRRQQWVPFSLNTLEIQKLDVFCLEIN